MRAADRSGAVLAAIVGPDEAASGTVTLRPLRDGGAQQTLPRDGIVDAARAQVASTRAGVSTRGQEG
jgi:histidyl-tRNA synthetase